jgi:RING-box protein 1
MEILKLDVVGSYSYKPDIEIASYKNDTSYTKECVICKRTLFEPSYEMLSDNKNILNETEIVIGKCGHIFHGDCLNKWLKTCDSCPIDKVKWHLHRVADTTTNLVVYECSVSDKFKKNKFFKNNNGEKKQYNNVR